jgi:hypothetical protein
MLVSLYWLLGYFENWYAMSTPSQIGAMALCVVGPALAYFAAGYIFGLRIRDFRLYAAV